MIKAEVNKNHLNINVSGEMVTILAELHHLNEDILSEMEKATGESKHHLLLLLTQNILKEWSEENETDGN
jgi:hypothetical protein